MRIEREKSVITCFKFDCKQRAHLPKTSILYRGEPLANLPAEAFAYLGVRASLVPPSHHTAAAGKPKRKVGLAPCLKAERDHVSQRTQDITSKIWHHRYLLSQMVPAMRMVAASRFLYSAPLVA